MNIKSTRRQDFSKPTDPIRSLGKIVSIASFGLFVIILLKYVDGRYHCELESSEQESLVAQSTDQHQRLERFQSESNRMQSELKRLDEQTITFAELTQIQDRLLALARQQGCTLKKASPRSKSAVDFKSKAKTQDNQTNSEGQDEPKAEYELLQAGLALNVSGDLAHILSFMKAVREQPWIASTDQLTLRREASSGGSMSLELELNFLSLQQKKSGEFGETLAPRT